MNIYFINIYLEMKVLAIGDPHFMITNIKNVEIFMEKLFILIENQKPELIVMLGDLLHEHERLHITPLNKAYDFIKKLSHFALTYCLVGNHDLLNNRQYLSENHWMNAMKEWDNVKIVDKVCSYQNFLFVPYVPPGRFVEALETYKNINWKDVDCIFAHQEFYGCKMGAILSEEGDKWESKWPLIVSGHIHSRQWINKNVYYPGASMQHAFGESEKNIIPVILFEDKNYDIVEHDLELPRKKIIYTDLEAIDDLKIPESDDQIKVTIKGNYEEFKTFRKTKKYKDLSKKGVKILYKHKKIIETEKIDVQNKSDFYEILNELVNRTKDEFLISDYNHVFLGKEKNKEIIIL